MMRLTTVLLLLAVGLSFGCAEREESKPPVGTKLLLFAVDSANWDVMTPMLEDGELPTIARLTREGSFGILKTGTPIQSPQMWTSVATGVVPERHGITSFVAEVPGTDREVPVTSNMRKVKAFWNILTDRGFSVGVVGWWPSWPAEQVNGFVVAQRAWPVNWSQHGIPFGAARDASGRLMVQDFPGRTYPEDLYQDFEQYIVTEEDVTREELDAFFGDSRFTDPSRQFHARWVYAKDKTFADGGLALLKRFAPDVFAVYFQGTDVVAHYYWGYQTDKGFSVAPADQRMYGRVVRNYYRFIDQVIARYLEAVGDDCAVLIVADHGFETKEDLKVRWERGEKIRTVEGGKDVPWDHGVDGAYIFRGPGIRAGHRGKDASVVDVTPTMLAYLGLPVARDMDGEPAVDLFEEGFLEANPITYVDTYETGEPGGDEAPMESPMDEGLKEKLRALGYIQ
jgi:predicted AlkP superfamily pyrophosphatase or phosphodiesterase